MTKFTIDKLEESILERAGMKLKRQLLRCYMLEQEIERTLPGVGYKPRLKALEDHSRTGGIYLYDWTEKVFEQLLPGYIEREVKELLNKADTIKQQEVQDKPRVTKKKRPQPKKKGGKK